VCAGFTRGGEELFDQANEAEVKRRPERWRAVSTEELFCLFLRIRRHDCDGRKIRIIELGVRTRQRQIRHGAGQIVLRTARSVIYWSAMVIVGVSVVMVFVTRRPVVDGSVCGRDHQAVKKLAAGCERNQYRKSYTHAQNERESLSKRATFAMAFERSHDFTLMDPCLRGYRLMQTSPEAYAQP